MFDFHFIYCIIIDGKVLIFMEYKHRFLNELSYLPEVNRWLDRYYLNSVKKYLNKFYKEGYSDSFFLNKGDMALEKQFDLDFIYKSSSFYEEYFKSLLDLSLIDNRNKDFLVCGIRKVRRMVICGVEHDLSYPFEIDEYGDLNISGGFIRGNNSDKFLKGELYNSLNLTLFDKLYTDFCEYYLRSAGRYSFLHREDALQEDYMRGGLCFLTLGLALYTTNYVINDGKSMSRPRSFCFDGTKKNYASYSEEAINAAFLVGQALFPQEKDFKVVMPKVAKFFMNNNGLKNYLSAFRKMGKKEEAFELLFSLGVVSDFVGSSYTENRDYDVYVKRILDICKGTKNPISKK